MLCKTSLFLAILHDIYYGEGKGALFLFHCLLMEAIQKIFLELRA